VFHVDVFVQLRDKWKWCGYQSQVSLIVLGLAYITTNSPTKLVNPLICTSQHGKMRRKCMEHTTIALGPQDWTLIWSNSKSCCEGLGVELPNVDDSWIPKYRYLTFPAHWQTDFESFGSWGRLDVLCSSLFCLRSERMVLPRLILCHCGSQEIVSFKMLKMCKSNLKTPIFVLFYDTSWYSVCTFTVLQLFVDNVYIPDG